MELIWQKVRGLGWLSFPAAVLVLLAILWLTWATPVLAQITWVSYQDAGHNIQWGGVGSEYDATYTVVYMYGDDFVKSSDYNVGYYDNRDLLIASDDLIAVGGNQLLASQYDLTTIADAQAGTWHASAYLDPAVPPGTWDGGGDASTAFQVLASAIPEFPTVIAAIGVAGLCFVIYWWMRKRRVVSRQTVS